MFLHGEVNVKDSGSSKFRVESVGVRVVPLKIKEEEVSLARCCRVPMIRYAVGS